jgi:hypothetical protein
VLKTEWKKYHVHSKNKWTVENFSSTGIRNILLQYSHTEWAMHDQILEGKSTLQYKKICCMNRGPMQHDFWVTAPCRSQEILEVSTRNFTTVNLQLESPFMSVVQQTNSSLFHWKHQTGQMFEYTYTEKANCILFSAKLMAINIKQVVCTENISILSHSRTKNCPATDRWQRENSTLNT